MTLIAATIVCPLLLTVNLHRDLISPDSVAMDFYGVLGQILDLLQRRGRVSYRALKRQFHLDDDYPEDLKEALLYAHAQVISDDGRGVVWTGAVSPPSADSRRGPQAGRRLHALLPGVMALLRQERRVTYRTLTNVFGLDETGLADSRKELAFKQLGLDEDGEGLVWTGEGLPRVALRCSPYHTSSVLYPAITHLEHLLEWEPDDPPAIRLAKLEAGLTLTPQQQKQQTLDGLLAWLVAEAEQQPGTPPVEAEVWLRRALDVARRRQAKSLELRAAMSLSRLWPQQSKRTEAHALLAPVYNWFTDSFDTADLQEAKTLLAELS